MGLKVTMHKTSGKSYAKRCHLLISYERKRWHILAGCSKNHHGQHFKFDKDAERERNKKLTMKLREKTQKLTIELQREVTEKASFITMRVTCECFSFFRLESERWWWGKYTHTG